MKNENQSNDTAATSGVDSSALLAAFRAKIAERIDMENWNEGLHVAAREHEKSYANKKRREAYEDSLRALDQVCASSVKWCHLQRPPGSANGKVEHE